MVRYEYNKKEANFLVERFSSRPEIRIKESIGEVNQALITICPPHLFRVFRIDQVINIKIML